MNYDVLVIIVLLNAAATFKLMRHLARTQSAPPRPKKKLIKSLWNSESITPKHTPPRPTRFPCEWDQRFFFDFADFADVVNGYLADEHVGSRWRLQELPETLIAVSEYGPDFGRNYAIFYNKRNMGKVQVRGAVEYGSETDKVYTNIQLIWPRLLCFDDVAEFLGAIALHVADPKPGSQEAVAARQTIRDAMLKLLWDTGRLAQFSDAGQSWGEMSLSFEGTPSWYLKRKSAAGFSRPKQAVS